MFKATILSGAVPLRLIRLFFLIGFHLVETKVNSPVSRPRLGRLFWPHSVATALNSDIHGHRVSIESEFAAMWARRCTSDLEKLHKAADQDVPG